MVEPFSDTNNHIGLETRVTVTQSVNPTSSRTYTAILHDLVITWTGGGDISITISDASNNTIANRTATLLEYYLP